MSTSDEARGVLEFESRKDFLIRNGWRKHLGSWWYKQLPEWGDRIAGNQQVFSLGSAYEEAIAGEQHAK